MLDWNPATYAAQIGITETIGIDDYTHEHQVLADAVAAAALKPLREAWDELYDYEDDAEVEAGINIALERMEKLLFSAAEIEARRVAEGACAKERVRRLISKMAGQEVTFEWGTETT